MAAVIEFPTDTGFSDHAAVLRAPRFPDASRFQAPSGAPTRTRSLDPSGLSTTSLEESTAPRVDGRSRLFAVIAVILVMTVAFGLRSALSVADADAAGPWSVPTRSGDYVVVGPGDTLDSIARDYAPTVDVGRTIAFLEALNGDERSVEVGQVLTMPIVEE